ncbi:trigger factor [Mariniblastus fucicola]|uniref:trigger factor n=1 Tax=Mariniblastus fucicola TaxID=980251 RepID=UPI0009464F49|nr:trigger factor [Mariniblastus fucicola]
MNTSTEIPATDEAQKLDLNLDINETSSCGRHVTVTVPRTDIERYYQKQFDSIIPKAEVPGFRVGKAPRNLVEKKFRKQVADQVKGALLMDSLTQISESEVFSAISEPDLDYEQVAVPDDGDLKFEFNIEVRPDFELPKWKGLKIERPEYDFTDADVDAELAKLTAQFSTLEPVEDKVAAEDYVEVNITTRLDGEDISSASDISVQVLPTLSLADAMIEDFDKLMIGAEADEKRTAKVTVNEFSENVELAGKELEIEFEILDVKRRGGDGVDGLAEKTGMDMEELRKRIKEGLESRLEYRQREVVREQISKTLTESASWELPQDLLRRQSGRELERASIEMRRSGFSDQEIRERENRIRSNILERTETMLREHFILERIAEDEKVEETEADYTMEIARIAAQQNDSPRRVRARLERSGQMDSLRNMIIEGKVIDMITEAASFEATKYEQEQQSTVEAIDFFAAGKLANIPEAKYEGGEDQPIPGVKPERE